MPNNVNFSKILQIKITRITFDVLQCPRIWHFIWFWFKILPRIWSFAEITPQTLPRILGQIWSGSLIHFVGFLIYGHFFVFLVCVYLAKLINFGFPENVSRLTKWDSIVNQVTIFHQLWLTWLIVSSWTKQLCQTVTKKENKTCKGTWHKIFVFSNKIIYGV